MSSSSPRYDGLDAIRAGAMLLGLAYHATYAWLPDVGPWYFVADTSPVSWLGTLTGLLHSFRMQVFFALSGFFSHLVYERRGARGFMVDRSKRLVLPLLVALPLVLLLDVALRRWSQSAGLMSPQFKDGADFLFLPRHLWFLIYLFTLCAIAWALPKWEAPAKWLARALRFPLMPTLLLAVPTCLALWLHPSNRPDLTMWPMPFELFHFGLFYAAGWWLWPTRESLEALRKQAPLFLAAGLGLGFFIFRGSLQWERTGEVLAGVVPWLMTMGAFGLAFRVQQMNRPGAGARKATADPAGRAEATKKGWLRFLVESSYWVYLVHFPVVQGLQVLFAKAQWPGLLEYVLATLLTFLIALLSFTLFVWRTPLGPWLGVRSRS